MVKKKGSSSVREQQGENMPIRGGGANFLIMNKAEYKLRGRYGGWAREDVI